MGNAKPSQNMTDKRFFWLSVYVQPALWIVLGVLALVRFRNPIWLILIGEFWAFFFVLLFLLGEREVRDWYRDEYRKAGERRG